ncbi:protein G49 [Equid gammaherpesvirus 2]|nr:protein G49 [Equid gammaherpesvirus 2]
MEVTSQERSVCAVLGDYHIPDEAAVLREYKGISVTDPRHNPSLSKAKTCLDRSIYMLKICVALFANRQREMDILQAVTDNVRYFLGRVRDAAGGCDEALRDLIRETARYSPHISPRIGERLLAVLRVRYPGYAPSGGPWEGLMEDSIPVWCSHHMTQLRDEERVLECFVERSGTVYSLSKFCSIASELFYEDSLWHRLPDPEFIRPYNLAVFWVGVMKKFESVLAKKVVDDHLTCYTTVAKYDIAAACEAVRRCGERRASGVTLELVDWLRWKLRDFGVDSNDSHASEIISVLQILRGNHLV